MAGNSKNFLPPFKIYNAVALTANQTSTVTDIRYLDNISIQLIATGTPTGTFAVQISNDYLASNGTVVNAGTWNALTLPSTPTLSGAASNIFLELNQLGGAYIRVVYTFSAGTGTLNGYITGKAI